MTGLALGLRLPPCAPLRELGDFARRAERAGVDVLWIPDSQLLWRDVWTAAAIVAQSTERIGIGVAVTNFETRHVSVTASALAAVDELSGGRMRLAVGTGDSAVKTLGRAPTRLARMREQIALLRALLAGERVTFAGDDTRFSGRAIGLRDPPARAIPVHMAASGPRALELAGEVADGVIVATGIAPALVASGLERVRTGAARTGRTLEDLDIWIGAHTAIADDRRAAEREVKPLCLAMAQLGADDALRSIGIDIDVPPVVAGIHPDITHAESWDLAILAAEGYIDDDAAHRYASAFTLAGTPADVAARIAAAASAEVDGLLALGPSSYELPHALVDGLARHLRGRLAVT